MTFSDKILELQKENPNEVILIKNGIFFVAVGKDAILLNQKLNLKCTCFKNEICKERFLFDKRNNKYFRLCNKEIFNREKRKLRYFKEKLKNETMKMENINKQYKCVRNSIVQRKNAKESLKRLDIYYNNLFASYY